MTLEEQEKKDAPRSEVDFKASFTDGFHIKSTDGNFDLHVGGRWLEEYRYTFNRYSDTNATGGGIRTSTNTFLIREAFISVDGTLFKDFGFKLNGDFSGQASALIEEGYVEWRALKEFRILFGSFKQPASFEITDSPRFAEFIQRSPMARYLPNIDTGIKINGSLADTLFTYEFAITNGRGHTANAGRGLSDDNDGKEYAARLTVAPFVKDKDSFLNKLRIGVYGTKAHEGQNNGINPTGFGGGFAANGATNLATNELGVTYLALPGGAGYRFHGDRYRVGGELTYAVGPLLIRGEVMNRHDEVNKPGSGASPSYDNLLATMGYYGEITYVLTGEDRIPNARIVPKHPFSLSDGGWGAVEVGVRFGAVSLNRGVLQDIGVNTAPSVPGPANSNRASSFTFGVNWWLTQNVKICLDYVGENYYQGTQMTPLHHGSHANGILARFQIDF
jgi:phosphate-selective porin OprO/OprP